MEPDLGHSLTIVHVDLIDMNVNIGLFTKLAGELFSEFLLKVHSGDAANISLSEDLEPDLAWWRCRYSNILLPIARRISRGGGVIMLCSVVADDPYQKRANPCAPAA